MDKQQPFGKKNTRDPKKKKHVQDQPGPNTSPRDEILPIGPGERSDEESIGRPVQLDKDHQKARQPGEGAP